MMSEKHSVNVWWVNQGGTYSHESSGAYFWAPLKGKAPTPPPHWRRMNDVRRGDIVLHYVQGFLKAIGRVETDVYESIYPKPSHAQYGKREGNLVETSYYELDEPVPRDVAANLKGLPESGGPFTSAGSVQQGYLFEFGTKALEELVDAAGADWPEWVTKFVTDGTRPETISDHPMLDALLSEIIDLNVAVVDGRRMRYKPLMLLAAMRALTDGNRVEFGSPLLDYYEDFCEVIGVDASTPGQPYFHLLNDDLWQLSNEDGSPFVAEGRPGRGQLERTHAEFPDGRQGYVLDPIWRPLIFGAVRTHFKPHEWDALSGRWLELSTAISVPGVEVVVQPPTPEEVRGRFALFTNEFAGALTASHLRFGQAHDDFVRTFVASLATKPFVILTGLSGSGKTQIAQQFGHWVGEDQLLVVPVRPDWTGSDALFGYEDALQPAAGDGYRAWYVPDPLRFMLEAARNPERPYVLVLDEMNLAHVERYFADVLSGMESGEPTLPNLVEDDDGHWRLVRDETNTVPVPNNLFIIGTVNVDETTYMFSPKVLDRANTIEFRVETDDLMVDARKPMRCEEGAAELVEAFLAVATDTDFHIETPHPEQDYLASCLRKLHGLLYEAGFEFGHRVFWESLRFASLLAAAGERDPSKALDAIVLQKVMPRLHGNRRRLEPILAALGSFCYELPEVDSDLTWAEESTFDPFNPPAEIDGPELIRSFAKVQRMLRNVQVNQFASFAE